MIIVDTSPKQQTKNYVNLGLSIVSKITNAQIVSYREKIDISQEHEIGFSIFYPLHLFNALYFIRNNGIEPLKSRRKNCFLTAGGQGISNLRCTDDIFDHIFAGEFDYDYNMKNGKYNSPNRIWHFASEITSQPEINGNTAIIELTRGCKSKCSFCEYSWVHGGKYREKDMDFVYNQLDYVTHMGIGRVNFTSTSITGYSKIFDLYNSCKEMGLKILLADYPLKDIRIVIKLDRSVNAFKFIHIFPESFDPDVRYSIGKAISNEDLLDYISFTIQHYNMITITLMYGLPNDDYNKWYNFVKDVGILKKLTKHPVRIDLKISDFEPCNGTPLWDVPEVDFTKKNEFIPQWINALQENGLMAINKDTSLHKMCGLLGRRECVYKTMMTLRKRDTSITDALLSSFHNGVNRWLHKQQCDEFLSKI